MPSRLIFRVRTIGSKSLPKGPLGPALHAEFLRLIRENVSESESRRLHDYGPNKPYGLSSLLVDSDGETVWRWCALDARTREVMLALAQRPLRIEPTGQAFEIEWAPEHPWAAHHGYEALVSGAEASGIDLRFLSPTFFRQNGLNLPLPLPRLMVASWLSRWNAHAETKLPETLVSLADEHLRILSYELKTEFVRAGKIAAQGFVGRLSLTFSASCPVAAREALAILLAFAPYAGTGTKTAMGFGQTLLVEPGGKGENLSPPLMKPLASMGRASRTPRPDCLPPPLVLRPEGAEAWSQTSA